MEYRVSLWRLLYGESSAAAASDPSHVGNTTGMSCESLWRPHAACFITAVWFIPLSLGQKMPCEFTACPCVCVQWRIRNIPLLAQDQIQQHLAGNCFRHESQIWKGCSNQYFSFVTAALAVIWCSTEHVCQQLVLFMSLLPFKSANSSTFLQEILWGKIQIVIVRC